MTLWRHYLPRKTKNIFRLIYLKTVCHVYKFWRVIEFVSGQSLRTQVLCWGAKKINYWNTFNLRQSKLQLVELKEIKAFFTFSQPVMPCGFQFFGKLLFKATKELSVFPGHLLVSGGALRHQAKEEEYILDYIRLYSKALPTTLSVWNCKNKSSHLTGFVVSVLLN